MTKKSIPQARKEQKAARAKNGLNTPETGKKAKNQQKQASTKTLEAKKEVPAGVDKGEKPEAKAVTAAKKPASRKGIGGRPSKYTQELADEFCQRVAEGETIRQICMLDHMPDKTQIIRWLAKNEQFRTQYARAKEDQADAFAEEIVDIADDSTNDWIERENQRGDVYTALNEEHISRSKLRIEARKWLMGKMKPKKYGDRTLLGSDPDNPLPTVGFAIVPAKNPA